MVAGLIQGVPITGHGVALAFALDAIALARLKDAAVASHAGEAPTKWTRDKSDHNAPLSDSQKWHVIADTAFRYGDIAGLNFD